MFYFYYFEQSPYQNPQLLVTQKNSTLLPVVSGRENLQEGASYLFISDKMNILIIMTIVRIHLLMK